MKYTKDEYGEDILLGKHKDAQVMMQWERPYMEACVDALVVCRKDICLEIGFGLGFSATHFLSKKPRSYTIVECEPEVIERIKLWKKDVASKLSPETEIIIVEGKWQEVLHTLGTYTCVFFDDYPLSINDKSSAIEKTLSDHRFRVFFDFLLQNDHVRVGTRISCYLNTAEEPVFSSSIQPFISTVTKTMSVTIPENCEYRQEKGNTTVLIPLFLVRKKYSFSEEQAHALEEMKRLRN